ncbi:NAD(P)/FAD-dependent oxidoreductase [Schleiferilactobacillus perolens]|jgi:NADH dehydrogenase|uniref:NADH dehydrogenase, FAD-containing subunit n=1 Tax=Schleiferilactobacillus perolens DSM 12744 TaxID=1423792 RepID=A0A0R1N8B7_9LACO|nr:NAD(P)/FAD-dependent oxidoreductase [Schleiferilactobacillus perolens]KRL14101.1 NADH dehydrogenase, FAD-containing subunit [Schleiferilactobacillus perolens DSM 12744]MCI1890723.1 NAD(P)/FAD-dependent oxidoreductase [Schleiferilactobacillus harbinensis]MCI1913234.1 NAD(P)/FAD-dependent oxidoreductase [Schleiferilactobacillus harbinensis]MCI2172255.1 NAD(P)/FAD-dependent oxidoreductase [Schleiferilactobacillus perolens]
MASVLILGAGYAGLRTAKLLAKHSPQLTVTVVNKNAYHYESTQLHEVAVGTREPADITFSLRQALPKNVDLIIDEVVKVDREKQQVELAHHEPLSYDYLVNSLGFESETFGIPGAEENGLPLIDIPTALAAREHLEKTLAHFNESHDPNDLRIIVCGAGFTSIEYLGDLVYHLPALINQYHLPADQIKIDCIEAMPKVLPMFSQDLADYAVHYLESHGVTFHTSTPITAINPGVVESKESSFKANTIIWTTGVKGSHVIADSGYDQKRNRVVVQNNLSVKDHPNEFVIGDVSAVPDPDTGRMYPTTGQIAIAQADVAARNIRALVAGRSLTDFKFHSLGTVCSLGPTNGVAEIFMMGHWKLKGHVVGPIKKLVNDRSVLELSDIKTMLESN